jgi:hypothetical protein
MFTRNKYNAKKTTLDGLTFDSRMEAERWAVLRLLEKQGLIRDLSRQVRLEIIPKTPRNRAHYYTADFVYCENGRTVFEDVKGVKPRDYILRRDMLLSSGRLPEGAVFREYTKEGVKDYGGS